MAIPLTAIGAGAGLLGSLFGGGGGISNKEVRNNFRWAVNELDAFNEQFQNSPELANLIAQVQRFSQDPMTYSPEFTANLKARYAEDSQSAYRGALAGTRERAGAKGMYRDGSTRGEERRLGQRLGSDIAQGNRSVDEMARKSRSADLTQLGSILSALTQMRMQPLMAETSARLGVQPTQQGNPFGELLQGIGVLSAGMGTAQQQGGGSQWGNWLSGGGGGSPGGVNSNLPWGLGR